MSIDLRDYDKTKASTIVMSCTCKHKGQDEFHGRRRRVFNYAPTRDVYRCTACGNEKGTRR